MVLKELREYWVLLENKPPMSWELISSTQDLLSMQVYSFTLNNTQTAVLMNVNENKNVYLTGTTLRISFGCSVGGHKMVSSFVGNPSY